MIEVGNITFHTDGSYHVNDEYPVNDNDAPGGNPPYRLRQWTGLNDKNGKEIYEGDIITYHFQMVKQQSAWPVIFQSGSFGFPEKEKGFIPVAVFDKPERFEVIGNIYENPELLK